MRSPEELVRIGFERSRVVIVNECHDGDRRCPRTRAIGRRLLPVAYEAGVRHLAMEALDEPFTWHANQMRLLPSGVGYLAQEDMRALVADALALGWDLVPYECDFSLWQGGDTRSVAFGNWRDAEEARNVTEFLAHSQEDLKLLVWCGNSHQRKTPQGSAREPWIRLGQRLREVSGIDPFVIDQSVTVEYRLRWSPRRRDVKRYGAELRALGGTAGFLREEDPDPRWRDDLSADAWLLSVDNSMS